MGLTLHQRQSGDCDVMGQWGPLQGTVAESTGELNSGDPQAILESGLGHVG